MAATSPCSVKSAQQSSSMCLTWLLDISSHVLVTKLGFLHLFSFNRMLCKEVANANGLGSQVLCPILEASERPLPSNISFHSAVTVLNIQKLITLQPNTLSLQMSFNM
jgi:hypothetical protein